MDIMPVFAAEFGYTPRQFRELTVPDYGLLLGHLKRRSEGQHAGR